MLQELLHPLMLDRVEKALNVYVQHPVHPLAFQRRRQRVERIVLAPSRAEAIAEPFEVHLVDRIQNLSHCSLHDLVFNRCNAQRSSASIFFRDVNPSGRLWPLSPPVNTAVHLSHLFLKPLASPIPSPTSNPCCRPLPL